MSPIREGLGRGSAPARAALAGNPSDGYHGAVLAVAIDALRAEATAAPAATDTVAPPSDLVAATVARVRRDLAVDPAPCAVRWSTSIPKGVGLAGSSAIVIATIRALNELHRVSLPPDRLAALALAVETEDLGIVAGPQDRVAQAFEGLTFMDFAPPAARYEALDPSLLAPLLVCWRHAAGADSGPLHAGLRERFDRGDPIVREALAGAATAAQEARTALLAGDQPRFCWCVNETFEARRRMMALDPRHVEMIALARGAGAAANYTGSGGAIVAVCHDPAHREAVGERLRAGGCVAIAPAPVGPTRTQDPSPPRRNPTS